MNLNTVIEKLLILQHDGYGECDVVFGNSYHDHELTRISAIDSESHPIYCEDEDESCLEQEVLISIYGNEIWEIGAQELEKIELEKQRKLKEEFNEWKRKNGMEGKPLKEIVLKFLRDSGLGSEGDYPRGYSPVKLRELFLSTEVEMRIVLGELINKGLIASTEETRNKKFVAMEYIDQARENLQKEKEHVNRSIR